MYIVRTVLLHNVAKGRVRVCSERLVSPDPSSPGRLRSGRQQLGKEGGERGAAFQPWTPKRRFYVACHKRNGLPSYGKRTIAR